MLEGRNLLATCEEATCSDDRIGSAEATGLRHRRILDVLKQKREDAHERRLQRREKEQAEWQPLRLVTAAEAPAYLRRHHIHTGYLMGA